jgi:hypothetical protein
LGLLRRFWISAEEKAYKPLTVKFPESSSEMFIKRLFMNIGEGRFREFDSSWFVTVFPAEIQYNLSLLGKPYSPFQVEFGMSSEFDFADFIPPDDMPLCDTTDHSLSLLMTGVQFLNEKSGQMLALPFESPFPSLSILISTACWAWNIKITPSAITIDRHLLEDDSTDM